MVERKQIYGNVFVNPEEFKYNINELLEYKLKDKYEQTCSKEYGFIIKIEKINFKDQTNIINTLGNGEIIYTVSFICLVLEPTKNMILQGQINTMFRHGIFANIDKIKILIPSSKLDGWTFNDNKFSKGNVTLNISDKIEIKIIEVRYEKKQYSCIGTINNTFS